MLLADRSSGGLDNSSSSLTTPIHRRRHPHLPSGHISSFRPHSSSREWTTADEMTAIHRARKNAPKYSNSPKPPQSPTYSTREWTTAEEMTAIHRARKNAPKYSNSPKPPQPRRQWTQPGTAADLPAATKAQRNADRALKNFNANPSISNRGGLQQEVRRDLQQALSIANARVKAAQANKYARNLTTTLPSSLNQGGRRQDLINDARQEAGQATTAYLNSKGLDSSGKPITFKSPASPKPQKEHKPWWKRGWDGVKDYASYQKDVSIGFVKGAWDAGKGLYSVGTNPAFNVNTMAFGMITNPTETIQKVQNTWKGVASLASNPAVQSIASLPLAVYNSSTRPEETNQAFKDLGSAFAKPYVDDWKSGHPGQSVGRGIFDVGSFFVPGGAVTKVGKGAEVATTVGKATKIATTATKATKGAEKLTTVASTRAYNVADFERYKASLAAQEIKDAPVIGTALKKNDPSHRSASFVVDTVSRGKHYTFKNSDFPASVVRPKNPIADNDWKSLSQVEGSLNGKPGIFEFIVNRNGDLTHQRFIKNGKLTGFPNQTPKTLG
jgi:hypothetical protein